MNNWSEALQALPPLPPPEDKLGRGWAELAARQQQRRRMRTGSTVGLALAASLFATVMGLRLMTPAALPETDTPQALAQLIEQSRSLEAQLAAVRPRARYWDSTLANEAVSLTDDLALVDLQLNYADDAGAQRLWQNRVDLMAQLVSTHQQAASRASMTEELSL